jgi:hypothetical protein
MRPAVVDDNVAVDVAAIRAMLGIAGHVPPEEIGYEAAMALCRKDYGLCWLITESGTATMNDMFNVARAQLGWQRYWFYYHPEEGRRKRCCDAYLKIAETLQANEDWCTDVGSDP